MNVKKIYIKIIIKLKNISELQYSLYILSFLISVIILALFRLILEILK